MAKPTEAQINDLIGELIDEPGPRFPGMTYEQGVRAALDWVLGDEGSPLEG